MRGGTGTAELLAASAIDWWAIAGVDTPITETPRRWLRETAAGEATPPPDLPIAQPLGDLPTTLDAFRAPAAGTIAPNGDPASGLMILLDMPEAEDGTTGRLLSGAAGTLFDRMLGAIGRERDAVYLASIATARTPTGRIDKPALATLAPGATRHVALAAPRVLVLCGDVASRLFLDEPVASARGRVHALAIEGRSLRAVATFHPRTLLQHPSAKAEAWADLRLIAGEIAR
jgi:uracil-DNA glycosylase family 4